LSGPGRLRILPPVVIALTLSILSIGALMAASMVNVIQNHRAFQTASLQIARGATVRFVNDDQFLHQVYVDAPSFNFESDEQDPGTNVDILFSKAGLFVRCHIHPKMLLQVEVR
jgi:plastocyanin